jgi:hypothetical protein
LTTTEIEEIATTDSYAGLVLLARLAYAKRDLELAESLTRSAERVILLLGNWLWAHGMAQPMADYFEIGICSMIKPEVRPRAFGPNGFLYQVHQISELIRRIEIDQARALSREEHVRFSLDLIYGGVFS